MCLKTDHTSSSHIHEVLFSEHLVKSQVSIGKIPGPLSGKNKSETGSSSSRVTLVVKLLRFLTVICSFIIDVEITSLFWRGKKPGSRFIDRCSTLSSRKFCLFDDILKQLPNQEGDGG